MLTKIQGFAGAISKVNGITLLHASVNLDFFLPNSLSTLT